MEMLRCASAILSEDIFAVYFDIFSGKQHATAAASVRGKILDIIVVETTPHLPGEYSRNNNFNFPS
jgi:hypothetical protein